MDDTVITHGDITILYEKSTNTFIFNGTGNGGRYQISLPELTDKFVSMTRVNLTENKHQASLAFLCYDFSLSSTVWEISGDAVGEESSVMYQHQGELSYGFYFNGTFEDYRVKIQIAEAIPTKNEAIPDLKGKTYLGNGEYELFSVRGLKLTYNVLTGIYTRTGTLTGVSYEYPIIFNLLPNEVITISTQMIKQGGDETRIWEKPDRLLTDVNNKVFTFTTSNESQYIFLNFHNSTGTEEFKLQIEKGTEATPFINPYVPIAYSDPSDLTQTIVINSPLQISDEFIIDAEFKEVKRNSNQAYNEIDKTKNTFPIIPRGAYTITSEQPIKVEWKEWVID